MPVELQTIKEGSGRVRYQCRPYITAALEKDKLVVQKRNEEKRSHYELLRAKAVQKLGQLKEYEAPFLALASLASSPHLLASETERQEERAPQDVRVMVDLKMSQSEEYAVEALVQMHQAS